MLEEKKALKKLQLHYKITDIQIVEIEKLNLSYTSGYELNTLLNQVTMTDGARSQINLGDICLKDKTISGFYDQFLMDSLAHLKVIKIELTNEINTLTKKIINKTKGM